MDLHRDGNHHLLEVEAVIKAEKIAKESRRCLSQQVVTRLLDDGVHIQLLLLEVTDLDMELTLLCNKAPLLVESSQSCHQLPLLHEQALPLQLLLRRG